MQNPTHAHHRGAHAVGAEAFGSGARLLLNHPDALNSLDLSMVEDLSRHLARLARETSCAFVLLSAPPGRAFCAGGDVKMIHDAVVAGDLASVDRFFETEYGADLAIHEFPKPAAALADGICMGGGLGLVAGCDVVAATEDTVMAMPEARIGFFPDVLATRWLQDKCPPGFAEYLTLTAATVSGKECVSAGLATHFLPSGRREEMDGLLRELGPASSRKAFVRAFGEAARGIFEEVPPLPSETRAWLSACFSGKGSVEEIFQALARDRELPEKSREALARMDALCPSSLVFTHRLLRENRNLPLVEVAQRDLAAARFLTRRDDYREGVRARLLEKGRQPAWNPAKLAEVRLPAPGDR
ncbi:MAG: enoyl-CoA hydratase/isomerase family protein [Thermodesulfobacteriota bacterium]